MRTRDDTLQHSVKGADCRGAVASRPDSHACRRPMMRLQHMHRAARYIGRMWRDSRNAALQAWKAPTAPLLPEPALDGPQD